MARTKKDTKEAKGEPLDSPVTATFTATERRAVIQHAGAQGKSAFVRDAVLAKLKRLGFVTAK